MKREKDPGLQDNTDSKSEKEHSNADIDARNSADERDKITNESDSIKNANAAGLGAIGRSDQNDNSTSGY